MSACTGALSPDSSSAAGAWAVFAAEPVGNPRAYIKGNARLGLKTSSLWMV
jgi:hypothetical protein